uniref:Uncharacterized protein n=1 Tax=Cacopsylla melanoneura TaxID=428564 RepID=A0A8D9ANI0_9HEMI
MVIVGSQIITTSEDIYFVVATYNICSSASSFSVLLLLLFPHLLLLLFPRLLLLLFPHLLLLLSSPPTHSSFCPCFGTNSTSTLFQQTSDLRVAGGKEIFSRFQEEIHAGASKIFNYNRSYSIRVNTNPSNPIYSIFDKSPRLM